jgi:ABC-type sugar transport system substrate-binding protein
MKKILAMLLVLAMICGLVACSSSDADTGSATDTGSTTDAAANDTGDTTDAAPADTGDTTDAAPADTTSSDGFTWNGQMEVWSVLPTTGAEGLVLINDSMGAVMEEAGFTYVKKDAQGDVQKQEQFIEDAIAAGNVGALMVAAMDVDLLQDAVEDAIAAGIAVAYLGAEPTNYQIAGCVYTAYEITGMYAVQAAEYWVKTSGANVPTDANGKYEIAIDTYYNIADGVYRSNAVKGTVESSDILTLVSETSSYGDSAYSDAYDNAKDVLAAHPDCHLFIAYEPEEAMGAADAIADYCGQNGLSVADYCVIPCYAEDTTFSEMYAEAEADPSANAIKGYATYGDPAIERDGETIIPPVLTGEHLAEILLGVCGIDGYEWTYGETYYDTITAVTVDGFSATWSMGDENPAAQYKTVG